MKKEYKSVIVLADLVGGTPFKTAVTILEKEVDFRVIGGINLPLVIELSMLRSTTNDIEELLEQLLITSQEAISEFKQVMKKKNLKLNCLKEFNFIRSPTTIKAETLVFQRVSAF
ncbi:hypothetical protein EJN90_00040 [Jeotgalibaca ciconiae]|uniref:PTS EIIA type-4 domain-containing protein n=1 Tax=Jeotgalibaca ciconiae TaxID=2496265 RepID=A0A3Q9BIJ6_9LACT|nr:hypothetical protein EJN90_00040 [Jeotgalibaca ciconiae]